MTDKNTLNARRKYFSGFCSNNVVNSIMWDDTIPEDIKKKAIKIAREIAKERGSIRVHLEDWEAAVKEVRE